MQTVQFKKSIWKVTKTNEALGVIEGDFVSSKLLWEKVKNYLITKKGITATNETVKIYITFMRIWEWIV